MFSFAVFAGLFQRLRQLLRAAPTRSAPASRGAVLRVRPKAMTVSVIVAALVPILWSQGTGSEVMQRIAAPMIGGMITAPLLSLLVIPAIYRMLRRRQCT